MIHNFAQFPLYSFLCCARRFRKICGLLRINFNYVADWSIWCCNSICYLSCSRDAVTNIRSESWFKSSQRFQWFVSLNLVYWFLNPVNKVNVDIDILFKFWIHSYILSSTSFALVSQVIIVLTRSELAGLRVCARPQKNDLISCSVNMNMTTFWWPMFYFEFS